MHVILQLDQCMGTCCNIMLMRLPVQATTHLLLSKVSDHPDHAFMHVASSRNVCMELCFKFLPMFAQELRPSLIMQIMHPCIWSCSAIYVCKHAAKFLMRLPACLELRLQYMTENASSSEAMTILIVNPCMCLSSLFCTCDHAAKVFCLIVQQHGLQFTTELASIQKQSQAAAQALLPSCYRAFMHAIYACKHAAKLLTRLPACTGTQGPVHNRAR